MSPRLGTWSRPKRQPEVVLEHNGWRGMRTTLSQQQTDPSLAHYIANWMPVDPEHGGPLRPRPSLVKTASATFTNVILLAQFSTAAGTTLQVMVANGEIWTYDPGTSTYTRQVTAANFTTATITVATSSSTQAYGLGYSGKLIVSDGTNTPWMWDGTAGAGGLTKLSNCPVLYGPPTEYYGKVVGIRASDRLTFVWSEELQPNLGYDTAPYTNFWTLAQTSTEPLVSLLGTNDGLYYFRPSSIGVVRGAMASDFRTTGVHDEVSRSLGITSPAARALYGSTVWFVTPQENVYALPFGGTPENVSPITHQDEISGGLSTTGYNDEPLGFGLSRWARVLGTPPSTRLRIVPVGPSRFLSRSLVFVVLTAVLDNAANVDSTGTLLVFDAETRRPLCWWTPPSPGDTAAAGLMNSACAWDDGYGGQSLAYIPQAHVGTAMTPVWYGRTGHGLADARPDTGTTASRSRLVTAAFTNRGMDEMLFDRVAVDWVASGNTISTPSVSCTVVTSAKDHALTAPTDLTTSLAAQPTTDQVVLQRKVFGFGEPGRWCRVVAWAYTDTGSSVGVDGVSVTATPIGRSPAIA